MSLTYEYFIAGRRRNHREIRKVLEAVRAAGLHAYRFIDNAYGGDGIKVETHGDIDTDTMMRTAEERTNWRTNPAFNQIFETDMNALRASDSLLLVFPAGLSAHMELGADYGIGSPEKVETLYKMFADIFPSVKASLEAKVGVKV